MGLFSFFNKSKGPSAEEQALVQRLLADLDSPDPKARLAACQEFERNAALGEPAAERLLHLIDDEDGDVCLAASAALTEVQRATGC